MNPIRSTRISRRHVLRGIGATMALPFMEAMGAPVKKSTLALGPDGQPIRYAAIFMPNGVDGSRYMPSGSNLNKLPPILQPLNGLTEHVNVVSGLWNAMGGHSGSTAGFLTGQKPGKSADKSLLNIENPSVDQIIAQAETQSTPLASLELAMHTPRRGVSPSGLPWVYGNCISWRNASTPVPQELSPHRAFKRLFDGVGLSQDPSKKNDTSFDPTKSVVDAVLEDAKQLQRRLGKADQQKMDEYLTTVRDVETRILRTAQPKGLKITPQVLAEIKETEKYFRKHKTKNDLSALPQIPYPEYVRMMMDVMALAFWSNSTRVSTLMLGDGASRRNMSFLDGVQGAHHSISHHGNKPEKLQQLALINTFFVSQYAYFLEKLHSMKEGSNSVLDNSLIMMGSSISNGNNHTRNNIPIILGGKAGGRVKGNRHIEASGRTGVGDFHSAVLDIMNIENQIKGTKKFNKL